MTRDVRVYPNTGLLYRAVAERFVSISERALAARGRFVICLAGGSTPRGVYELLTTQEYTSQIDWNNAYIFWGDERSVPPESVDSNARMARETLLNHVPVPVNHIYRIHGELPPVQAAEQYDRTLRDFFRNRMSIDKPRFDLVLLGMGADGHTASLFPGTSALREQERWVVANHVPSLNTWRITLTASALNAAANILFLVAGAGKAAMVKSVLEGPDDPVSLPSQLIAPENGALIWMLDEPAAARLTNQKT